MIATGRRTEPEARLAPASLASKQAEWEVQNNISRYRTEPQVQALAEAAVWTSFCGLDLHNAWMSRREVRVLSVV